MAVQGSLSKDRKTGLQEAPHTNLALKEDVNALMSITIKLNGKIGSLKRKLKPNRKSLPRTSVLRCSKCECYVHETHQCPNWNESFQLMKILRARPYI